MLGLVHQQSLTYEVSHLVCDSTRCSDEGIIALIILHLHLKEPCEAETGDVFSRSPETVVLHRTVWRLPDCSGVVILELKPTFIRSAWLDELIGELLRFATDNGINP